MDLVRKIHRGSTGGKLNDAALRRQTVDMVVFHGRRCRLPLLPRLCIGGLGALLGSAPAHITPPGQELTQPRHALLLSNGGAVGIARLFVAPMRSNTEFGKFMHGSSADLNFNRPAELIGNDGMERLITIGLGIGNIVVILLRQNREVLLHNRERFIALLNGFDDDSYGPDVKELIKAQVLALHLFPNGIDMLRPARHLGLNTVRNHQRLDLLHRQSHEFQTFLTRLIEFSSNLVIFGRMRKAKREVFELPLDLPNTESISQGRINGERFLTEFHCARRL